MIITSKIKKTSCTLSVLSGEKAQRVAGRAYINPGARSHLAFERRHGIEPEGAMTIRGLSRHGRQQILPTAAGRAAPDARADDAASATSHDICLVHRRHLTLTDVTQRHSGRRSCQSSANRMSGSQRMRPIVDQSTPD